MDDSARPVRDLAPAKVDGVDWTLDPDGADGVPGGNVIFGDDEADSSRSGGGQVRILILTANPVTAARLALDHEVRAIEEKIRLSRDRDNFKVITGWAVRPDDLLRLLNDVHPHIVHFSGHGTRDGKIVLSTGDGTEQTVSISALADVFRVMNDNIRVVVLNACFTAAQAQAVSEHVDFVVAMRVAIEDRSAAVFSAEFYSALGHGRSVVQAFEQARAAIRLHGLPGHDIPQLRVRKGADPFLITKSTPRRSKRSLVTVGIALLLLMISGSYAMIWMGLSAFYGEIGVDMGELPVQAGDLMIPLLFTAAFMVASILVVVCLVFSGGLLAPWPPQSKVAIPASALAITVFLAVFFVIALTYAGPVSELILNAVALALIGNHLRLVLRQRMSDLLLGYGFGVACFAVALFGSFGLVRALHPPAPWPIVIFVIAWLAPVGLCGWRLRNAFRRQVKDQTAATTPMALLSQTVAEFLPTARDLRAPRSSGRALTIAVGLLLAVMIAIVTPIGAFLSWLDDRANAGQAVLHYGYVPAGHTSLLLPTSVRPTLVLLRHAGDDPLNVCGQAASILASDGDVSWVLLRPVNDENGVPAVVKLSAADYIIRLTGTTTAETAGKPWTTPACS